MPDLYNFHPPASGSGINPANVPPLMVENKPTEGQRTVPETIEAVLQRVGEQRRRAAWGAYTVCPGKRFISEQQEEEVVLMLRAHPITNIHWILLVIGMLILPMLLEAIGIFAGLPVKLVFIGRLAWYLVTLGFAFEKFLDWYYSVFIVTNERIIDVDFQNLLYRVMDFATLNHIEEPSMVMGGFVQSFFRYGNVMVETAAEVPGLVGENVPYPDRVIKIISELSEELEERRGAGGE